jgi:transposase
MLSQAQRTAILELNAKRVSKREIARVLQLSRLSVRKVLRSNSTQVPEIQRAQKAEPYRQQILDLWISCKGNLVRVHEELRADGAKLSYPALTAFCRRQGIGQTPVVPAGQYHFEPGVEMQHDTSPHEVEVGGRKYLAQTASAVLCYSRLLFFQINPRFQRFDCKVFLTDALRYMGGVVERVMIDNTHVVVLRGTGREMIPVPEMEAFAERFGFRFVAHERGDANRSARVERPFAFIENNFLAGRRFASWDDLNQQARQWCDRVNSTYKKHIRAVPRELFAVERLHLKPLPAWIPEVYRLHPRTVDVEGYVSVNSVRYSVPVAWIGRRVEVRETRDKLEIELDARHTVTHVRALTPPSQRITLAEHRPPRGEGVKRSDPHPEEQALVQAAPEIAPYVAALKQKGRKVVALALRQLLRLLKEYPRPPFLAAVREAAQYGLYDLDRLERMILRRVAQDYFLLLDADSDPHD